MLLIWLSLYSSLGSIMLKAILSVVALMRMAVAVEESLTRSASTSRCVRETGLGETAPKFGFVGEKDSVIF